MELTEEVINGLSYLSTDTIISDEVLKQILAECVNLVCNSNKQINLPPTNKQDILKLVQFSIISLFIEHLRSSEDQDLSIYLTKLKLNQNRADLITRTYNDSKIDILKNIALFNDNHIPHITEVKWKLDYVIQNNESLEKELLYRIQLVTNKEPISFCCNKEQLQDLVFKLKDIQNHCSKLAAINT